MKTMVFQRISWDFFIDVIVYTKLSFLTQFFHWPLYWTRMNSLSSTRTCLKGEFLEMQRFALQNFYFDRSIPERQFHRRYLIDFCDKYCPCWTQVWSIWENLFLPGSGPSGRTLWVHSVFGQVRPFEILTVSKGRSESTRSTETFALK